MKKCLSLSSIKCGSLKQRNEHICYGSYIGITITIIIKTFLTLPFCWREKFLWLQILAGNYWVSEDSLKVWGIQVYLLLLTSSCPYEKKILLISFFSTKRVVLFSYTKDSRFNYYKNRFYHLDIVSIQTNIGLHIYVTCSRDRGKTLKE